MERLRLRISTEGKVRRVDLRDGNLILGRSEGADVHLEDRAASREHLRLRVAGGEVLVEDLGSRNGSRLEGVRLRGPVPWRPGQRLTLGATTLVIESPSREAPRAGALLASWARAVPTWARIAAGLAAVLLPAILLLASGDEAHATSPAVRLEEAEARGLVFGRGGVDVEVGERLEISWRPKRPLEETLVWLRAGIEPPEGGMRLEVNGLEVASFRHEAEGPRRLRLPKEILREGENLLAFVMEDAAGPWSLWDLSVEEEPRPRCGREACVREARRWLQQGRESRERQAIDPGNLHAAWLAFRRARTLLEGLDPKPELYATAIALLEEAEAELEGECRRLRFGVVQSLAFGREEEAVRLARRMLRTFPGPEHACHERARDFLERLEGWGGRR
jgi:hypothetical protein